MYTEFQKQFADKFFQTTRRVSHFTLGGDSESIFEYFHELNLPEDDQNRFLDAVGIDVHLIGWRIGIYTDPFVVCGELHQKYTVAVFQNTKPGSRFAIFSVHDGDDKSFEGYATR